MSSSTESLTAAYVPLPVVMSAYLVLCDRCVWIYLALVLHLQIFVLVNVSYIYLDREKLDLRATNSLLLLS